MVSGKAKFNVQFESELYRQLRAHQCYTKLNANPTVVFSKKLEKILLDAFERGIIPKMVYKDLQVAFPMIPTLYLLPKVTL